MLKRILIILIIILIFIGVCIYNNFNDHYENFTVTLKERVQYEGYSKYLIMGKNDNNESVVFENVDNLFRFKFNSSEFYEDLKIGERYKVTLVGYRIPIFSWYENIISYEKLE